MSRHRHRHRDREPRVREHQHREVRGADRDEEVDQRRSAEPQRRDERSVGQPQHLPAPLGPARLVAGAQRERPAEQRREQSEPARPEHGRQQVLEAGPDADRVGDGTVRALEGRLQRQQQQGAGGRHGGHRGHRPPAARRQAAVGIDVGQRERPQEEQRPFRSDDEPPDTHGRVGIVVEREAAQAEAGHHDRHRQRAGEEDPRHSHAGTAQHQHEPDAGRRADPYQDPHGIPQADRDVLAARLRDGARHDRARHGGEGERGDDPGERAGETGHAAILSHARAADHGASPECFGA